MSKQLLPPLNSFMFSDNPNLVGFPAILVGMIDDQGQPVTVASKVAAELITVGDMKSDLVTEEYQVRRPFLEKVIGAEGESPEFRQHIETRERPA